MNVNIYFILFSYLIINVDIFAQEISSDRIPTNKDILYNLQKNIIELDSVYKLIDDKDYNSAALFLSDYFKNKFKERYFFNWQNFNDRFEKYKNDYPDEESKHFNLANYQQNTFAPETKWLLPFKNLKGEEVTAYELRHLSRQQKSMDMALAYYYSNNNNKYFDYFIRQVKDLNRAFEEGEYDDEGNGVYEVFRAGKRINNWLFVHNAYLASKIYTTEDQLILIKTFLHHGAQFYKRIKKFKYGNHQTKGLVALFEIAALFPEFKDSNNWMKKALEGLEWHITNEINDDGFQFERSVHYHMGDILNYFRVYQLAQIKRIELPQIFNDRLKSMFDSMISLAQPNKYLPVLQDDTDSPFAENNDVSSVFTIATLMFNKPQYRYFSEEKIPSSIYWLLSIKQLGILEKIKAEIPKIGSSSLPSTGYYTMRSGWEKDDLYMTISAGLSENKPDHQHGDMLGIVAYANGTEILPNYQVRYKYEDYIFWKNSFVKNVALVDSIPLGRGWNPNRGKSGFGKWKILPTPKVLSWINDKWFDYFAGTHNSYDSINVDYTREILFIKDKFWIVKDEFKGENEHYYQQFWQGFYQYNNQNKIIYSNDEKGSGIEIFQLNGDINKIEFGKFREKGNVIFKSNNKKAHKFITVINPYNSKDAKIFKKELEEKISINDWQLKANSKNDIIKLEKIKTDAQLSLYNKKNEYYFIDISKLEINGKLITINPSTTIYYNENDDRREIKILGYQPIYIKSKVAISIIDKDTGSVINNTVFPKTNIEIRLN